jgi:hypothetical protein
MLEKNPLALSRYKTTTKQNGKKMLTSFLSSLLFLAVTALPAILSTPLDDYVWKYDENYKWVDMVRELYLFFPAGFLIGLFA